MDQALSTFGLTKEQLQVLFGLECYMVEQDRLADKRIIDVLNPLVASADNKTQWYHAYRKNLEDFLRQQNPVDSNNTIIAQKNLHRYIKKVSAETDTELWKYLVLLECTLFTPYFPMSEEDSKNKVYKGLKFNSEIREKSLGKIAEWLEIDIAYVNRFEKSYESIVKKMTGYWNKVFIGVGAGVVAALLAVVTAGGSIAAMFAAEGLYGIAAISSGLAALGGGAIAAGGFGMAGGLAVLVGGGTLLGAGAGGSVGMILATASPDSLMTESAKMWVVLKEILMGVFNDTKRAQAILNNLADKVMEMKKEIAALKIQQAENKAKIKNLEKSVSYLEKMMNA